MSRGWALGSAEFKRELLREHHLAAVSRAWDAPGIKELRSARWQEALDRAKSVLPRSAKRDARKAAPWKVAVAAHLKASIDVTNNWLAGKLDMGSGVYVSKHVGLAARAHRADGESVRLRALLGRKVKGKA